MLKHQIYKNFDMQENHKLTKPVIQRFYNFEILM